MQATPPVGVEAAVAMGELGYPVHPCRLRLNSEGTKVPDGLPGGWEKGGLLTEPDIRRAWAERNANAYLISCGPAGVTVVDLDRKGAVNGMQSWQLNNGPRGMFEVTTWSGGRHLYFASTGAHNGRGVMPCVDIRGIGGGVFGPGSSVIAANGVVTGWYTAAAGSATRGQLSPEPTMLNHLRRPDRPVRALVESNPFFASPPLAISDAMRIARDKVAELGRMPNIPGSGMRQRINDTALYLGGLVHTGAFTHDQAYEALARACAAVFGTPDGDDLRWIGTALTDGERQPVVVSPDPVDGPAASEVSSPAVTERSGGGPAVTVSPDRVMPRRLPMIPDQVWKGYGWARCIRAQARAADVCPDAVLGAMLATYSSRLSPSLRIDTGTKMPLGGNLVISLVGPSGSDKSTAFQFAQRISPQPSAVPVINNPGSGEAFAAMYVQPDPNGDGAVSKRARVLKPDPRALFYVAEGALLGQVGARLGSTWLPHLRALAVDESLSTTNATAEINRQVPAMSYSAGVVVGFQVTTATTILHDTGTGTAQRFLWFTSLSSEDGQADAAEFVPMSMPAVTRLAESVDGQNNMIYTLCVVPDITAQIKSEQRHARLTRDIAATDDHDAHRHMLIAKLAAIATLADDRVLIELRDWRWAERLYAASSAVRNTLLELAEERETGRRDEAAATQGRADQVRRQYPNDVARVAGVILRAAQRHGLTSRRRLRDAVAGRDRVYFNDGFRMLEQAGQMAVSNEGDYYSPLLD